MARKIDWTVVAEQRGEELMAMTRDECIMALVGSGISLNAATKGYVEIRKVMGLQVGRVSHKAEVVAWLQSEYDLGEGDELDGVMSIVQYIMDRWCVSEGAARDYIKADAEQRGYTLVRGTGGGGKQANPILDWMVEHAPTTEDGWDEFEARFVEWMQAQDKSASNIDEYRRAIRFHRMLAAR